MFSYTFMKILESAPRRYDRGIGWLTFGHIERVKQRIVQELLEPGLKVCEIGCGTGTLALMLAKRGMTVFGFDASASMLEVAREKIAGEGFQDKIEVREIGAAEMDRKIPDAEFDAVVSTLVFSELSGDERRYALKHALRCLKPGGRLIIADEVRPAKGWQRLFYRMLKTPMAFITYVFTQTNTRAVEDLPNLVSKAGFEIETEEYNRLHSFALLTARKEEQ